MSVAATSLAPAGGAGQLKAVNVTSVKGDSMLTAAQIGQFKADGYLKGGRVLTDEQVGVLQEEIERVIRDVGTGGPQPVLCRSLSGDPDHPVWQIVNIWEASEPFRALIFT